MLVQKVSDLLTEGQIGVGELQVHGVRSLGAGRGQ
jgi:hypothetical protein